MTFLPQRYKVDDPSLQGGGLPLIDEGDYKAVMVTSSPLTDNRKGTGQYILSKIVIIEGKYAHQELSEYFNVVNPNKAAENMAYAKIAQIAKALGYSETPQSMTELHNKPFMIRVKNNPGNSYSKTDPMTGEVKTYDGSPSSSIKEYFAIPAVGLPGGQVFGPSAVTPLQPQVTYAALTAQYAPSAQPQPFVGNQPPAGFAHHPQPLQPTAAPATPSWAAPNQQQG